MHGVCSIEIYFKILVRHRVQNTNVKRAGQNIFVMAVSNCSTASVQMKKIFPLFFLFVCCRVLKLLNSFNII